MYCIVILSLPYESDNLLGAEIMSTPPFYAPGPGTMQEFGTFDIEFNS